jgi:hypothetical protein
VEEQKLLTTPEKGQKPCFLNTQKNHCIGIKVWIFDGCAIVRFAEGANA